MKDEEWRRRAEEIVQEARRLADDVDSWADFSNAMYQFPAGLLPRAFSRELDRKRFVGSPQGLAVKRILRGLQRRFGLVEGAKPTAPPPEFR